MAGDEAGPAGEEEVRLGRHFENASEEDLSGVCFPRGRDVARTGTALQRGGWGGACGEVARVEEALTHTPL